GAALLASDRLSDAKECLDRALLLAPSSPAARLESARLDLHAGDTNAAVDRLRLLLRDRPGDKAAQSLLRSIGK
ncbi:MAG: tetratricopeptide repeat protein, partial [Kiritimatiellae bacterium]|nr:tetratricopeptide repeat protein [Kiritimatiellia bacterium]